MDIDALQVLYEQYISMEPRELALWILMVFLILLGIVGGGIVIWFVHLDQKRALQESGRIYQTRVQWPFRWVRDHDFCKEIWQHPNLQQRPMPCRGCPVGGIIGNSNAKAVLLREYMEHLFSRPGLIKAIQNNLNHFDNCVEDHLNVNPSDIELWSSNLAIDICYRIEERHGYDKMESINQKIGWLLAEVNGLKNAAMDYDCTPGPNAKLTYKHVSDKRGFVDFRSLKALYKDINDRFLKLGISCNRNQEPDLSDSDILQVEIEFILMCRHEVSVRIFDALKNLSRKKDWQKAIYNCSRVALKDQSMNTALHAVILETLRRCPLYALWNLREVSKATPLFPVFLEKGTLLRADNYISKGLREEFLREDESFHPELWCVNANKSTMELDPVMLAEFTPFGEGDRKCIAEQFVMNTMTEFIWYVVNNFHIIPVMKTNSNEIYKLRFTDRGRRRVPSD